MNMAKMFFVIGLGVAVAACGGGGGGGSTPTNTNPVSDAGLDQTVLEGTTPVQLAGTGSDAEGSVTYSWTQTSGTTVALSDTTISNPTFTAPMVASTEMLVFALTVTDSDSVSAADTVIVTVEDAAGNTSPTVNAGPDQTVAEGTTPVQLAGTGSDAEGPVTYSWTQTSGTTVSLSDATISNPTFTAPMVASTEILEFTLTVTDSGSASVMDTVSISVTDTITPPPGLSYLFYSNSLNAVDPANPASPILIEPTANLVTDSFGFTAPAKIIRTGTVDIAAQTVTNEHAHAVIYPKTDGRLYKVSALKSGSLTPVQVSSESQIDQMCTHVNIGNAGYIDLANVDNSQFLYVLPGADTTCNTNDDIWKMVRVGMSPTDAPISAKKPVSDLDDPTTGAISGWLVHDAGALKKCDANFANCTSITAATSVDLKLDMYRGFPLLEIDDELFVYNESTSTLSSALFTIASPGFISALSTDGTTIYFGHGSLLYEMPADGSSIPTVLATEISDVQRVEPGTNSVVYQIGSSGSGVEIKSIPKAGGTAISLATATGTDDLIIMFVKGDKVYYNIRNVTVTPSSYIIAPVVAGVVDEDGAAASRTETASAAWSGNTYLTSYNVNDLFNLGTFIDKVLLAEGYDLPGTAGGYAGATIKVVDAATAVVGTTLGTLSTTVNVPTFACYGFGDDALCSAFELITPTPAPPALFFQNDIYYLNAATANSLTEVTNTAGENEVMLF